MLMNSLIPDVCDWEEHETGLRREGFYSSMQGWIGKAGIAVAFGMSGIILGLIGFKQELGGSQSVQTIFLMRGMFAIFPVLFGVLALVLVKYYPLTVQKMAEVRAVLEARRGAV